MVFKFLLSRPGYDHDTDDPRELILSSDYNAFKISAQGVAQVTINNGSSSGSTNVAHGLGYVPSTVVYFELASGKRFLAGTPVITGLTDYGGYVYMDGTNLVLFCNRAGTTGTVTVDVYYYILKEPTS